MPKSCRRSPLHPACRLPQDRHHCPSCLAPQNVFPAPTTPPPTLPLPPPTAHPAPKAAPCPRVAPPIPTVTSSRAPPTYATAVTGNARRRRRLATKASQLPPVFPPPQHLPTTCQHASQRRSQGPTPGTTHFAAMCSAFATNNSPLPITAPPCEPHKAGGYSPSAHAIIDPTSGAAQSYRQLREDKVLMEPTGSRVQLMRLAAWLRASYHTCPVAPTPYISSGTPTSPPTDE